MDNTTIITVNKITTIIININLTLCMSAFSFHTFGAILSWVNCHGYICSGAINFEL